VSGTLLTPAEGDQLAAHFARVAAEARAAERPLFAAFRFETTLRDVLDVFAAAADRDRFHFEAPARAVALAAEGEVARIETAGATRFADAAERAESLFAALRTDSGDTADPAPAEAGPVLVGGFAFSDAPVLRGSFAGFGALSFVLPAVAVARVGAHAWCTLSARISPGDDPAAIAPALAARAAALVARPAAARAAASGPPRFGIAANRSPDEYCRSVRDALYAIAAGELEKVVLARACTVTCPGDFDAAHVLATLRAASRACISFGVGHGGACFVGATPERLLRLERRDRISTSALAGSAPRGRTPEEDERLATALRESKKEQVEHAVVRRAIKDALVPCCEELRVPESPELLQLDGIQHLHTPIEGRLRSDTRAGVLRLVERLHPTAAVGGAPRAPALRFLAAYERLDRGWYAGGVGWLAPNGDGEIVVALRCAVLRGGHATLYAGAGIVEGSQPEAELEETRLKLGAALTALVQL